MMVSKVQEDGYGKKSTISGSKQDIDYLNQGSFCVVFRGEIQIGVVQRVFFLR